MNNNYKQRYATEKYVDEKVNVVQVDMTEYDVDDAAYVKHRFVGYDPYLPWSILSHEVEFQDIVEGEFGVYPLVTTSLSLSQWKRIVEYSPMMSRKYCDAVILLLKDSEIVGSSVLPVSYGNKSTMIDENNYMINYMDAKKYNIYVIVDTSTLTEQYASIFSEIGIYLVAEEGCGVVTSTMYSAVTLRLLQRQMLSIDFIPDTIARTADVIPTPESAEVGQTFRVSEVDENGKVTAVEAVNMPTGGEGGSPTETDPTVPAWAKESTKPTYTADEVGAYSKAEIDAIMQSYINDIATLVGGDA